MGDSFATIRPWITFAGCVLVVAVLHWAQAVIVPVALAVLITFVLTPPVVWLQRRIRLVPAVLLVVTIVFSAVGLAAWGLVVETGHLVDDLPRYRSNIRAKIADVRGVQRHGAVEKVQQRLDQIKGDLGLDQPPRGTTMRPVVVTSDEVAGLRGLGAWLGPLLEPLATAGAVIVLVIFMLIERQDLRGRVLGLAGHGHLAVTTRALDEASERVSRQLLMQTLVNAIYGAAACVGLLLLGVPYALLWASLGAALRFIPYAGPVIASAAPILVGLATLPGWTGPLMIVGFYVALELFTNLVLETVLYADAAGVSQVALLVAVAFWTWLWGPLGLLLATPLTVCLVVLGKHVPGLEFVGTMMADQPALPPESVYYQRLLAGDQSEAAAIVEDFVREHSAEAVYDGLLLPALTYAERDALQGRLEPEEEAAVWNATRDLMTELAPLTVTGPTFVAEARYRVFGYPANGQPDAIALGMLDALVRHAGVAIEVSNARLLASEVVALVEDGHFDAVCVADLPPSAPSRTRYLVKRLRRALPDVPVLVGRWGPAEFAEDDSAGLPDAGASHVAGSMLETRDRLVRFARESRATTAPSPSAVTVAS